MYAPAEPASAGELRRAPDVARQVGLSLPHIYRLIARDEFPAPVHLGRAARWVGHEVDTWIADRIAERDAAGGAGHD